MRPSEQFMSPVSEMRHPFIPAGPNYTDGSKKKFAEVMKRRRFCLLDTRLQ
jgi:hypothetical protein